jgi:hypothetical protein
MDEGRKRVLLIAASILAARKLAMYEAGTRVPATVAAIGDAIRWAGTIMNEIDRRWPVKKPGFTVAGLSYNPRNADAHSSTGRRFNHGRHRPRCGSK